MQRHIRLLLTGLAATAILAAAVGTASAQRLALSNQLIRVVWANLELSNSVTTNVVRCPVTLEGSFHSRTLTKAVGSLIGYITRAVVRTEVCTGGRATVRNETIPWHVTYQSFTGNLPNITAISLNLIRAGFIIETGGLTCTAITSIANPARGIVSVSGGRVEGLRADEATRIPLSGGLCGLGTGSFRGTGTVTLLGTNNAISITLI